MPPHPLLFDRVNEGRPASSSGPLFKIPMEVLNLICCHVPSSSLAALALVSRDCRQLARSRQFASVQLDYSDSSLDLLDLLWKELQERVANKGATQNPSLGVCIRRITVATNPAWVTHRHNIGLAPEFEINSDVGRKRIATAGKVFFGTYLPRIQFLLRASRIGVPQLELLDWEDKICLSSSFFNDLSSASLQHLKLFRVSIAEEFVLEPVDTLLPQAFELRSLHLEIIWSMTVKEKGRTGVLCASILRLCAPTLESLTWDSIVYFAEDLQSFQTDSGELPEFPRLRYLRFGHIKLLDSSVLHALVHDNLLALEVDISNSRIHDVFFEKRGTIASLEILVWDNFEMSESQSLDFLRANPQLSSLCIRGAVPIVLLEETLLPLLSESFTRLTSLCLKWDKNVISPWALRNIVSMKTLTQLHLIVGDLPQSRLSWEINHNSIRRYLRKLPLLRKLAFSKDTYRGPYPDSNIEGYYRRRELDPTDPQLASGQILNMTQLDEHWELLHRLRMLAEAHKYFEKMSNLEWVYFGQLPMGVMLDPETKQRYAITLSNERDSCWTLLREMFGWKAM